MRRIRSNNPNEGEKPLGLARGGSIFRLHWIIIFLLFLSFPSFASITLGKPLASFQGQTFSITLSSDQPLKNAQAVFNEKKYPFYKLGDIYQALIGTMPEIKPGNYSIEISGVYENDKLETIEDTITIKAHNFPKVSFWIPPVKKKTLMKPTLVEDEWSRVEKILLVERPERLWNGIFSKPVPGITTMFFGTREMVNNEKRGQHRGEDLRAAIGTTVKAPNSGEVVFADTLKAFGGTLVIDHGQGVHTLYFHLSKFLVPVGTLVSQGQNIALSGNSGISSGPHLHWGMSVHNVRVDPMQWVKEEL